MARTRTIQALPLNGGLPCGDVSELDPCNTARCPQDRAEILVDRIRKLELQDRINTLEELQVQQAAQLAATQTTDLLNQIGGAGAASTGSATGVAGATSATGVSFIEMLSDLYDRMDSGSKQRERLAMAMEKSRAAIPDARMLQHRAAVANLESLKSSIAQAKADLADLQRKDKDTSITNAIDGASTISITDDEDEITDEVDAQGHHHKKHHHRRRRHNVDAPNSDNKFSQTAPAAGQLDPVPPLFAHTVTIPAGNNNDFISTHDTVT